MKKFSYIFLFYIIFCSLQGMENKKDNENFKNVQNLYQNALITYKKHIIESPKELIESTENWLTENKEFVDDVTNPENCIEKDYGTDELFKNEYFYKRKKKYDKTYNNKSKSNFLITNKNNTWNYRLSGMIYYEYRIEPSLEDYDITRSKLKNYYTANTEYGFYQNSYCYINSLIAKEMIKKYNLTKFKPVECHLVNIPGRPNYFSDRCNVLVEENIPDSKPLGHEDVLNELISDDVQQICDFINKAGAFDLNPKNHDNIRKDSEGFYRWVDMEPHPRTPIINLLSKPEDRPIFPFLYGLEDLLQLFENKHLRSFAKFENNKLRSFAKIVIKNAKNWILESDENIKSFENNFAQSSLASYITIQKDDKRRKKQKTE